MRSGLRFMRLVHENTLNGSVIDKRLRPSFSGYYNFTSHYRELRLPRCSLPGELQQRQSQIHRRVTRLVPDGVYALDAFLACSCGRQTRFALDEFVGSVSTLNQPGSTASVPMSFHPVGNWRSFAGTSKECRISGYSPGMTLLRAERPAAAIATLTRLPR